MEEQKKTDLSSKSLSELAKLSSPNALADRIIAAFNAVPVIGGTIATWILLDRQKIVIDRIQECLLAVVKKLELYGHDLEKLNHDQHWIELSVPVLEITGRTQSKNKRECFANMLANAAIYDPDGERERAYSMSALLDQLDYVHVKTLDRLMKMRFVQSVLFFGAVRTVPDVDVRDFEKDEHYALGVLEELGLIDMSDLRSRTELPPGEIHIRSRGLALHRWITDPSK